MSPRGRRPRLRHRHRHLALRLRLRASAAATHKRRQAIGHVKSFHHPNFHGLLLSSHIRNEASAAGESMASSSESVRTLDAAVGGIPRVAKAIAEIPNALRQRALEAAERSYRQTVRDLGYPEPDAEVWTCAVIFRVRSQVAQYEEAGGCESEAEIIKIRKAAKP